MDDQHQSVSTTPAGTSGMFAEPPQEKRFPVAAVGIASAGILILLAFLLLLGHRKGGADADPNSPKAAASYAANMALSNIQMSESESLSGGKVTYIDGHIVNNGPSTITGITAQVSFANDQGTPPQMMSVPLNLVRMREPYIDTQPVSAAPIAPGGGADFRLIFEGVNASWNSQTPEIRLTRISTR